MAHSYRGPLRVGIGGPVGAGKTTLVENLCKRMRAHWDLFVITNDIYTKEDQLILNRAQALPEDRIMGVETGGCPHTAIREDASINLVAIDQMSASMISRLAPHVGANLEIMDADTKRMRGERPYVFTNLRTGQGVQTVIDFIVRMGGLTPAPVAIA